MQSRACPSLFDVALVRDDHADPVAYPLEHAERVQGHVLEVDLFDLEHAQDLAGRAVPERTGEHALITQQGFILGPRHAQDAPLPDHAAIKRAVAVEAAQERRDLLPALGADAPQRVALDQEQ